MTETNPLTPPAAPGLPADPKVFWCAAADLAALHPPAAAELPPALERLGPSPFPKSRFRFLSFLATVYDHVAAQANAADTSEPGQ